MAYCDEYDHSGFESVLEQYDDVFYVFHDKGEDGSYSTISQLCEYRLEKKTVHHERMPIPKMISEDQSIEFVYYGIKK